MSTITKVANMITDMMQVSGELDRFFGEAQEDLGVQVCCSDDADEARHWQGQHDAVKRFGEVFMSLSQKDIDRLRLAASLVDEVAGLQSGLLGYVDRRVDELGRRLAHVDFDREPRDSAERLSDYAAVEDRAAFVRLRDLLLQIGSTEE